MYGQSYEPPMRIGLRTFVGDGGDYGQVRVPWARKISKADRKAVRAKLRGLPRIRLLRLYRLREIYKLRRKATKKPLVRNRITRRILRLSKQLKRKEIRTIRRARRRFRRGRMPPPRIYRKLMVMVRLSTSPKRARVAHNLLKKMSGRS